MGSQSMGGGRIHSPAGPAAADPDSGVEGSESEAPLFWEDARIFRAMAARANYRGMDRPDISFAATDLCRRMSVPQDSDLVVLRHLV